MGDEYFSGSLSAADSNRIINALRRYANHINGKPNSNGDDHSRYLNACDILNKTKLTGIEIADLLLKGDKSALVEIINGRKR
jgi:hypothetical protein